ncbi:hypothetical protein FHX48_002366 [Microbacterium halimionae]|uniref:Uncharacterized protein n=1 Tax=Microbacterium halimionae TaxID=1526413 RepID=A0A7W3JQT8_9MICO|nr:permease prefix domain 1-containing protein [Microbacterium halimionae]MBA8817268.1 hypothetical protein [Microbacterium halimionae]NII94718.1 hypothetical protein [Microbacterium halimionae]
MNVIITYLDTMFSTYPQTPRLLEAKAELRDMMEDAYSSLIADGRSENEAVGQVIRDFGNLEEVAPALGITSDIAHDSANFADKDIPEHPPITIEEAQGYADVQQHVRFRVSTAVILFVMSPAALILLPVAAQSGFVPFTDGVASLVGLVALLALITIGVVIILATSRETARYGRIPEGRFATSPAVTHWAEALAMQHERGRIRALQIAIAFWILAPIPLIGLALLTEDSPQNGFWSVIGVVLVLAFVATGLGIFLPRAWAKNVAEELVRGAGHRRNFGIGSDGERSIVGVIAAFYWPFLTAAFLAWSFIGNAWGISWVIWPVGAVLFGAIAGGTSAIEGYRRARP